MNLLVDLADRDGSTLPVVGGKGANLGVLKAAGLPVPDGFCIATQAYRAVVGDRLADLLERLETAGPDAVPALAAEARRRVLALDVPADLREEIVARYRALGGGPDRGTGADLPVAVRSSATAEDLATASFAGQQDTYLNVVGADAVVDAVRACWASLWTDRAVSYRQANQVDHRTVSLAVVVQQMVDARAAGVMFTANPVTGTRQETVIDASPGLGEAVVSGAVNPDHWVVDHDRRVVLRRRLGDKRTVIVSRAGGGTERRDQPDGSAAACLEDAQVLELAELGRRVQDRYAAPQDTEWALDQQGRFWLTQARPITTLYPLPSTPRSDPRVFMCLSLAQGLTRPITPMGLAGFRLIATSVSTAAGAPPAEPMRGPSGLSTPGFRLFVDITPALQHALSRRLARGVASVMEARTAAVLRSLDADPRFAVRHGSPIPVLRPIVRVALLRAKVPPRLLTALVSPAAAYAAMRRVERQVRRRLAVPADASAVERVAAVEQGLGAGLFLIMPRTFAYPACGLLLLGLARRLLGETARPGELHTVLRSLPHNVTTEMDLELWRLSERIRADADAAAAFDEPVATLAARYRARTLPPVVQQGLTGFLRRYGHRAIAEIDLGMPRWSEDPTHLLGVVANYLRLDPSETDPEAQFRAGVEAAESKVDELVARLAARHPGRARLVRFALRRARQLAGLRESPKFLLIVCLAEFRRQLLLAGAEAAHLETIDLPDDAFFLDTTELRRALAGERMQALVAERREAYEVELQRRRIPRLLLSDGTEPEAVATLAAPAGAITGSPASPGTVTGPARVVLDPVGARLEPGEILVAPSTDPGWTPLFLTAGGLVMEMGGSNSHGAVVAREYGIPAVVGVSDATQRIRTGQTITVDGASGTVLVADPD